MGQKCSTRRHRVTPVAPTNIAPTNIVPTNIVPINKPSPTVTETPSRPLYSKVPLAPGSNTIRLIQVLPGDETSVISCRFLIRKLQDSTPYTALSYRWKGDGRSILVDGEDFKIGESLWQFLHLLRERGSLPLFWVDAICIDQGNVKEKSFQVPLMKDIYSKAAEVFAWLGVASATSNLAIRRIKNGRGNGRPQLWSREEGIAMLELFEREYWSRIWIVQEYLLAKTITLYCGRKSFSDASLSSLFSLLKEDFVANRMDIKAAYIKLSPAASIVEQREKALLAGGASFPLPELINKYKNMNSTETCDKVYGLLALVPDSELEKYSITADYSKTPIQIFQGLWQSYYSNSEWWSRHGHEFENSLAQALKLPVASEENEDNWKRVYVLGRWGRDPGDRGPLPSHVPPINVTERVVPVARDLQQISLF